MPAGTTREKGEISVLPAKGVLKTADQVDYIEMSYSQKWRHGASGEMAPVELERQIRQSGVSGV